MLPKSLGNFLKMKKWKDIKRKEKNCIFYYIYTFCNFALGLPITNQIIQNAP